VLNNFLQLLINNRYLSKDEAQDAMTIILETAVQDNKVRIILEEADPHQIAAFLAILRYRGETSDEIAGMITALQKKAIPVKIPFKTMDIVGTGGDLAHTVNISTGSAILAAACGIPIAKHGNRSVSSKSGSADVLEQFGIDIETPPSQIMHYLDEIGIVFMFAPNYHPSLKKLSYIRKGLKFPTVFNLLGPLLNPARTEYALIGVANTSHLEILCKFLLEDKSKKRTLLFHGNGLDELSTIGKMIAYDIRDGKVQHLELDPEKLGFSLCSLKDLQGGDAQLNASILKKVFAGEQNPIADTLTLNAGAALWIFGKTSTLEEGVQEARKVLKKGKALEVLEKWVSLSNLFKVQRLQ
jgi:anthranilate phosphoribosyltransferase